VVNENTRLLTVHVETIESLSTVNDADFLPPRGAAGPLRKKTDIGQLEFIQHLLKQVSPVYPNAAKRAHVQGTVTVRLTIGKDGHVTAAKAISGPALLRKAAEDCVQQWKFKPFSTLGQPVEAESTIDIFFALPSSLNHP
jgi:TonB family protein